MAKKFSELKGVTLIQTIHGETKTVYMAYDNKEYKYEIKSEGDRMYMLDRQNNYEIVELIVKLIIKSWNGKVEISAVKSTDAEKVKNYIPHHYGYSDSGSSNYRKYFINFESRGNRSHYGLFFTELKEAEKYQKQLRDHLAFIYLKPGDPVYVVLDNSKLITAEVSATKESFEDNHQTFHLGLKGIGTALFSHMMYEERASELLEDYFYTYKMDFKDVVNDGVERRYYTPEAKFYLKKEDAEKSIKDSEQRKRKSATDKYLKQLENHDGKPISHSDKKGKQLHYGDRVAYAVSGGSSYPRISFGVVKGESKERVSIVDEEKDRNGNEEKHSVSPRCILLIEEAKYNTNSGYAFVKSKE